MTNDEINDIIDALNEGIALCFVLEGANILKVKAVSVGDELLYAKNILYDSLNGK
jgi:hypothetical protein